MTKEELQSRGWVLQYEINGVICMQKGNFWADDGMGASLKLEGDKLTLSTTDAGYNSDGPNWSIKFSGKCETIKNFDTICRRIQLKI